MNEPRVLALIMAGGAGNRMELLTSVRAKPALPFAGMYRLIDIPLSHCVNSHLRDVWVSEQFQPHSINEHLINGRPWDLDRTYGGLRLMPPHQGTDESGWHAGNADAIYRNRRYLREWAPDIILVLSADHLYRLDYRRVIAAHRERNAAVTMVTTEIPRGQATRFSNVIVGKDGKVTEFAYKPDEPISGTVTTEVFVYDAPTLLNTLDELAQAASDDAAESGLEDFGHQLLPQLVAGGRAYNYPLDGYWRDVGTIDSYFDAHMEFLADEPPLKLDDPAWPIRTFSAPRMAARICDCASVSNSLVAPGCDIRGSVSNSVLGSGVVIAEGADVRDAIIFNDVVIGKNVQIHAAIIDQNVQIAENVQIGDDRGERKITLIGQGATIRAGTTIAAGRRVEPQM